MEETSEQGGGVSGGFATLLPEAAMTVAILGSARL